MDETAHGACASLCARFCCEYAPEYARKASKCARLAYLVKTGINNIYFCINSAIKQRWFSGRILACHAGGPGSIPGRCKLFELNRYFRFAKLQESWIYHIFSVQIAPLKIFFLATSSFCPSYFPVSANQLAAPILLLHHSRQDNLDQYSRFFSYLDQSSVNKRKWRVVREYENLWKFKNDRQTAFFADIQRKCETFISIWRKYRKWSIANLEFVASCCQGKIFNACG